MKAIIETIEPTIRPVTAAKMAHAPLRPSRIRPSFVPARAETALFHAWAA